MKQLRSFLTLVAALTLFVCNAQTSGKIKTISAVEFANLISTTFGPQILDVRTPEEFESNHIANATNSNWLGNSFSVDTQNLDKNKPVFVYCKSGNRSGKAVKKLEELGFKSIYELDGGLLKWEAAGMKKLKSKTEGMTIEEYENLLASEKIVLISFKTDCTTCKQVETYLKKLEKELSEKLTIIQLDADENKTLLSELDIQELPTLLIYKNKNISWRHSGFISEEDLRKQLQ
jgi:rhodanese-related sulfurtransferase